ncbi:MAG: peptidoglycan DD-metalloendopeptidase family protein [Chitinophagales bacterium]|nr:peptidoglycan DD-metalloendopeptidase family protein [Chitinophagales bacterium]
MKSNLIKIFLLTLFTTSAAAQSPAFITPIEGTYLKDFFLVNYVDWSFNGIEDYNCGIKTYDGHQGTDFVIRNFSQMDSGVNVYAAVNGKVTFTIDTFFDRNKTAVSGGLGNYVSIVHEGKYYTYYGHLKLNSIIVQTGDSVVAGQKIGEVGSSGYTSDPHLHFEVWYDSLYNVDPFSGPCGNPTSLFQNQLQYIDSFGIIDHGLMGFIPTLDTLKERIPTQSIFSTNDDAITFWMQGYGVQAGDVSKIKWYAADGSLWFSYNFTHPTEYWYFYWWSYIDVPATKPGLWKAEYYLNNELKITQTFTVKKNKNIFNDGPVYFNFSESVFNLNLKTAADAETEVEIFDLMGRKIASGKIEAGNMFVKIQLPNISKGIYFFKIAGLETTSFAVF